MSPRLCCSLLLLLACASAPAGAAGAQAPPDTSGFFRRWVHGTLQGGVGWMKSPQRVSDRYSPGVAFGGTLGFEPVPRLRLIAAVDYVDLPQGNHGYYGFWQVNHGDTMVTLMGEQQTGLGKGRAIPVLAEVAGRVWRGLWFTAGAGGGYFDSGYPDIQFIDGATGQYTSIPGRTGWGPAVSLGATYEFFGRRTDHLFVTARWLRLGRESEDLVFVPVRLGYRFD